MRPKRIRKGSRRPSARADRDGVADVLRLPASPERRFSEFRVDLAFRVSAPHRFAACGDVRMRHNGSYGPETVDGAGDRSSPAGGIKPP